MSGAALALTQLRNELFGDYTEKNYLCRHKTNKTDKNDDERKHHTRVARPRS